MGSESYRLLKRIIDAKAIVLELEAVGDVGQSGEYLKYSDLALGKIKTAREYRDCLKVLAELESGSGHQTIKQILVI